MEEKFYTTVQAAEKLGCSLQRIQVMVREVCPKCNGKGDFGDPRFNCDRCRGTGYRVPHIKGPMSGKGYTAMIYAWALDLPDVKHSWPGRGHRPTQLPVDFVVVPEASRGDSYYEVQYQGKRLGSVYRHEGTDARRSWYWILDGADPQGPFRDMSSAAVKLWEAYDAS